MKLPPPDFRTHLPQLFGWSAFSLAFFLALMSLFESRVPSLSFPAARSEASTASPEETETSPSPSTTLAMPFAADRQSAFELLRESIATTRGLHDDLTHMREQVASLDGTLKSNGQGFAALTRELTKRFNALETHLKRTTERVSEGEITASIAPISDRMPTAPFDLPPQELAPHSRASVDGLWTIPGETARLSLDFGLVSSLDDARERWRQLLRGHAKVVQPLFPVVTVVEPASGAPQLRLLMGPIPDQSALEAACQSLSKNGETCVPALFEGTRIAIR